MIVGRVVALNGSQYRLAAGIFWTVLPDGVSIHDLASGHLERIAMPESIVWDLIARGIEIPDAMQIYQSVVGEPESNVEEYISSWVRQWIQHGWIEQVMGGGNG